MSAPDEHEIEREQALEQMRMGGATTRTVEETSRVGRIVQAARDVIERHAETLDPEASDWHLRELDKALRRLAQALDS